MAPGDWGSWKGVRGDKLAGVVARKGHLADRQVFASAAHDEKSRNDGVPGPGLHEKNSWDRPRAGAGWHRGRNGTLSTARTSET